MYKDAYLGGIFAWETSTRTSDLFLEEMFIVTAVDFVTFFLLNWVCVAADCPVKSPPVMIELDCIRVLFHCVSGSDWCSVKPNPNPPVNSEA